MHENETSPTGEERTGDEPKLQERAKTLAGEASRELLDKANLTGAKGLSSVGRKLDEAADYLRDRAPETAERLHVDPRHVDQVADRIHGAADYLQANDPRSVLSQIDKGVQEHPYRALLAGAAIGYLVGRLFRRRD